MLFSWMALMVPLVGSQCEFTIGVYSIGNVTSTAAPFSNVSNLCVKPYTDSTAFINAVAQQQIDYTFCTPTLNNCFLSEYNLQPVAGLISNGSVVISGDILVNRASTFMTTADLRGTRLICGPPYVTAIFQIQAAALNVSNFFAFFSTIRFENNQTTILYQLATGNFDVAFFRSDQIDIYWDANSFSNQFRILDERLLHGQMFASSTRGYPEWEVLAQPYINTTQQKSLAGELFTTPFFGPSYSYRSYLELLQQLSLVSSNGTCWVTSESDIDPYVTCPVGNIKLSEKRIQDNCEKFPVQCANASCICQPCYIPVSDIAIGLRQRVFWPVLLGIILIGWCLSWTLQLLQTGESMVTRVPVESLSDFNGTRANLMISPSQVPVVLQEKPRKKGKAGWSSTLIWQRIGDNCRVVHPNIVQCHGVTKLNDRFLIVQSSYSCLLKDALVRDMPDTANRLRLARDVASGLQRLHADNSKLLHRVHSRSVVVNHEGHAQIVLTSFHHPPTKDSADDISYFGWFLYNLFKDTTYNMDIIKHCVNFNPRLRPTITQVLVQLIAAEQAMQTSHIQLLNSILPPFITESLSRGEIVDFKRHPSVAIIFTDIVGFTNLCSSLDPVVVGSMLVRLYRSFDRLATKFNLYKIEIVGDAYVACTNVVADQSSDYAARIAAFGIELVSAAASTSVVPDGDEHVTIRVGIHVGPVVAGVVGEINPKFCLFGDSMNTASRMESNSLPGKIHLSQTAANAVRSQSPGLAAYITERGVIDVKGKGKMQTYWLN